MNSSCSISLKSTLNTSCKILLGVFTFLAIASTPCLTSNSFAAQNLPTDSPAVSKPTIPPEQSTPRKALRAFIDRMERDKKQEAAELIDLSSLGPEAAKAKDSEIAYKLFVVMSRLIQTSDAQHWPPTDQEAFLDVPDEAEADSPWKLSNLGPYVDDRAESIEISRSADHGWRFSADTVTKIEELFLEMEKQQPDSEPAAETMATEPFSVWFRKLFPEFLREKHFLMQSYQWLCLILIAVVGRVMERASRYVLRITADTFLRRNDPDFKETTAGVWKPVGRLVHATIWYWGAYAIGLPLEVVGLLLIVLKLVAIVAALWASFAVIELVAEYFLRRAKRRERKADDLIVPVISTTAKIITVVVSILAVTAAYSGELPTALIGGLGIGGVAIALAAQETLANFFSSITVLLDRPFEVGDWVIIEGVEGEVESVGFRSTKIRTGLNSQVTLPNNKLAAASVDNWGRRRYRRYLTRICLEYQTPVDRIEAFCEGARELIRRQPHTRKDRYAVYFNDLGASPLEILLICYFDAPDYPTELRERHRLLVDIVRLAQQLGVSFAFPTQTIHMHQGQTAELPSQLTHPEQDGQRTAADIAGELLKYQDRPGRVKFTGPTPIENDLDKQYAT